MQTNGRVAVLEHDRDLGGALDATAFAAARSRALASRRLYPRGPWVVRPDEFESSGSLGLLVLEGLLVRKVSVGERACAELLGPGDILQPWLQVGSDSSVSIDVNWDVAEEVTIAVLDRGFAIDVAPWPEIATTIAGRIMARTHWLAFQLALCHIRRIEERLLLILWHVADRWGRMTPRGAEITISLPHWLLAFMIGARRPSVTLALKQLTADGLVERLPRSRLVLLGGPPPGYLQLHADAAQRQLRPCSDDEADRDR